MNGGAGLANKITMVYGKEKHKREQLLQQEYIKNRMQQIDNSPADNIGNNAGKKVKLISARQVRRA